MGIAPSPPRPKAVAHTRSTVPVTIPRCRDIQARIRRFLVTTRWYPVTNRQTGRSPRHRSRPPERSADARISLLAYSPPDAGAAPVTGRGGYLSRRGGLV